MGDRPTSSVGAVGEMKANPLRGQAARGRPPAEVIGNGSIGGVLFCAEGAGGCEAVAEMLKEQAAAALLLEVAVVVTGRMALALISCTG